MSTFLSMFLFLIKRSPRLLQHTIAYYMYGPPRESWPLSFHLTLRFIKSFLSSKDETDTNEILRMQKATTVGLRPPPPQANLTRISIEMNPTALQFFDSIHVSYPSSSLHHKIECEWVDTKTSQIPTKIILYLHGGAYVLGSAQMYYWITYPIASKCNARVLGVNYRLAPQYPFPCALMDALSCYLYLEKNYPQKQIILVGDSAGGGLCMALILAIRDLKNVKLPLGSVLLSPWLDLTHSFPSFQINASIDFLPNRKNRKDFHFYATNDQLKHPYVSPVWASDVSGLCPILIIAGNDERLRDETMYMTERIGAAKGKIKLELYKDMVHVFVAFGFLNIGKVAMSRVIKFIQQDCQIDESVLELMNEYGQVESRQFLNPPKALL